MPNRSKQTRSWFGVTRFIHKWQSPGRNNIFGKGNSSISIHHQSPISQKPSSNKLQTSMWRVLSQRNNTVKHCRNVLSTWETGEIHLAQSENCTQPCPSATGCVTMHSGVRGWFSQQTSNDHSMPFSQQTQGCLTKGFSSRSCFSQFLSLSHFSHSLGLPLSSFTYARHRANTYNIKTVRCSCLGGGFKV